MGEGASSDAQAPLIEFRNVTKRFGEPTVRGGAGVPGDVISVVEFFFLWQKVLGSKLFAFRDGYSSFPQRIADKLPDGDSQKPVVTGYTKAYQQKTGQPVSGFGGHAYDGLMIFAEAAKRAGSFDKAKVRDEIEKTKNFIGTGGVVNMSPTDHLGLDLSAFRMLEIKGGDWTLVQ